MSCICLLTNKYQKYKSFELGDQLVDTRHPALPSPCQAASPKASHANFFSNFQKIKNNLAKLCAFLEAKICTYTVFKEALVFPDLMKMELEG